MIKMTKEKLTEAIEKSISIAEALKHMNLSVSTGNYRGFRKRIKEYELDISHFLGQSHLLGKANNIKTTRPLDEILVENSNYTAISSLKKRLIRDGIIVYECAICKLSSWQNSKLSLQLDHVNGNHTDNRIENLRFLCPNCHSQTETFAGRKLKITSLCECGKEKCKDSNVCRQCSDKNKQKISLDDIIIMVENTSIAQTAKTLRVTYNTIWKKIKKYKATRA